MCQQHRVEQYKYEWGNTSEQLVGNICQLKKKILKRLISALYPTAARNIEENKFRLTEFFQTYQILLIMTLPTDNSNR